MDERETPRFVATIDAAPPTAEAPAFGVPPTAEMPALSPTLVALPDVAPSRAPRERARGRPPRVMSRVLLVAIAAAGALFVTGVGNDMLGALRGGATARTVPVEGGSLLRAVALEAALRGLPAGRVETLRVAADRIDARVVAGGRVRLVRVTSRGWVIDVPGPGRPSGRTVRVDPRAPARIIRRTGRRATSVSHLTLERGRWQIVFQDGALFSANTNGRAVRRG